VNDSNDRLLSVAEAAELLGVSRWRVNQFINEKRLAAQKIGRSFVVKESDLEAVKERKTGRPPKAKGESK
jgi:excisionase family DNA binding protein